MIQIKIIVTLFVLLAGIIRIDGLVHPKNRWVNTNLFSSVTNNIEDVGKCPNALKCSGEYRLKGCDGSGKIQGGIATVPLLSWWPIKVYRPCPSYLKAGYQYKREGQTMDQVLFSEPSTKMKEKMAMMREEALVEANNSIATIDESDISVTVNEKNSENNSDEVERLFNERFNKKE
eukprot:gene8323-11264_t